nr:coiled-coil domain-containing protein 25-like isoform X3 [Dermatophagoides farinae]XP_046920047.1 coiled-coil domain-containing protein 25-like isoform X3 [Dermatophagoides farinae]
MVLYFTSEVVSPPYLIYMGNDKFENEELLKWAWPEDVWFHVDKESSAHVYLRLKPGETLDDIPSTVLDDCAQLVKANSIKGNKISNLNIVYTFWTNLKKTADMEVGQVGFHDYKQVRSISVQKRINEIVNRLNKTKLDYLIKKRWSKIMLICDKNVKKEIVKNETKRKIFNERYDYEKKRKQNDGKKLLNFVAMIML